MSGSVLDDDRERARGLLTQVSWDNRSFEDRVEDVARALSAAREEGFGSDDDWIVVTVARSGHVKHVRRSAISSFGSDIENNRPFSYITFDGRSITVRETEAQLEQLLRVSR